VNSSFPVGEVVSQVLEKPAPTKKVTFTRPDEAFPWLE
jgi:hypothetical protein